MSDPILAKVPLASNADLALGLVECATQLRIQFENGRIREQGPKGLTFAMLSEAAQRLLKLPDCA